MSDYSLKMIVKVFSSNEKQLTRGYRDVLRSVHCIVYTVHYTLCTARPTDTTARPTDTIKPRVNLNYCAVLLLTEIIFRCYKVYMDLFKGALLLVYQFKGALLLTKVFSELLLYFYPYNWFFGRSLNNSSCGELFAI